VPVVGSGAGSVVVLLLSYLRIYSVCVCYSMCVCVTVCVCVYVLTSAREGAGCILQGEIIHSLVHFDCILLTRSKGDSGGWMAPE